LSSVRLSFACRTNLSSSPPNHAAPCRTSQTRYPAAGPGGGLIVKEPLTTERYVLRYRS